MHLLVFSYMIKVIISSGPFKLCLTIFSVMLSQFSLGYESLRGLHICKWVFRLKLVVLF